MKFHENIHKDKGLWSCDIRKQQLLSLLIFMQAL